MTKSDFSVDSLGRIFFNSGYFPDLRNADQAIVKILAGLDVGIPPFASMTGIHIIKGKPSFGASLIAAIIKASKKYSYRVKEMTDQACRVVFYEHGEEIGVSEFTLSDAKKAGTQHLDKFPRNMLFARAISNGAKWFCPDLFTAGVYTPEELELPAEPPDQIIEHPTQVGSKRDKMIDRIVELGGDGELAETLPDEAIVAYGVHLKTTPNMQDRKWDYIHDVVTHVEIKDDVCYIEMQLGTVAVIKKQSPCWSIVVNNEGTPTIFPNEEIGTLGWWGEDPDEDGHMLETCHIDIY